MSPTISTIWQSAIMPSVARLIVVAPGDKAKKLTNIVPQKSPHNVTAVKGKVAQLSCKVIGLGNRTVRSTVRILPLATGERIRHSAHIPNHDNLLKTASLISYCSKLEWLSLVVQTFEVKGSNPATDNGRENKTLGYYHKS